MSHFGMPGPGGSLGQCALCGENFLAELILGKSVKAFSLGQNEQTLYGHDKCLIEYDGKQAMELPAASPIRKKYEAQQRG